MDQIILDINAETEIVVDVIGGDLRLTGWDQPQFVAESDDDHSLQVSKEGGKVRVHARADCRLNVPEHAPISLQNVGGDARVKNMLASVNLGSVGGDLTLRQVGEATIGRIGGDLKAKNLEGGLRLDSVGGDVQASHVAGSFTATNIGGDLYVRDVEGGLTVSAGGDVALNLDFQPGLTYSARAGGDLTCRLAPSANVRLDVSAGGDIEVDSAGARVEGQPRQRTVTLGDGQAAASLRAGGDVSITGLAADPGAMGDFGEQFGDDAGIMAEEFASQIESQIESMTSDIDRMVNARLAHIEERFGGNLAEEIAAKARRAAEKSERSAQRAAEKARRQAESSIRRAEHEAERARRRAEQVSRHAEHGQHMRQGWPFSGRPPMPPTPPVPPRPPVPPAPPKDAVTQEERMIILRMVEQGKISVADAEQLLAALENR